jgi:hypothetical protein
MCVSPTLLNRGDRLCAGVKSVCEVQSEFIRQLAVLELSLLISWDARGVSKRLSTVAASRVVVK